MTKECDAWISEPEAGILLQMTPNGVLYQASVGRLHSRRRGRGRLYRLSEIRDLAAIRAVRPERRGRPSARRMLERRGLVEMPT
jgi:hypothetical protein